MKKKKYLFFILLVCAVLNDLHAQRFKGGMHIGLLATQVDGDDFGGYKKPGLFAGAFVNVPFEQKQIKLQLEIDYAQKGSRSPSTTAFRYRIVLHQIEIPVVFGWNFWKNFSLDLGLSPNIIASAKEYYNDELIRLDAGGSKFYSFEFGGIGGVNYMFKDHYALFFRFNYSISPLGRSVITRSRRKIERGMFNNAMLFGFSYQF